MLPKIDEGLTTLDCGRSFEQIVSIKLFNKKLRAIHKSIGTVGL